MQIKEWQVIFDFLKRRISELEVRRDPPAIVTTNMLRGALYLLETCYSFENYLEDPRAQGLQICAWCKKIYKPLSEPMPLCSAGCEEKMRMYPVIPLTPAPQEALEKARP